MLTDTEKEALYKEFRYNFICELQNRISRHPELTSLSGILHVWRGDMEIQQGMENPITPGYFKTLNFL